MTLHDFKDIELGDKHVFDRFLREDPPQCSEFTFTNLFMWRHQHHPVWLQWDQCLLVILQAQDGPPFGLPPVGSGDKTMALDVLTEELERLGAEVLVCRVGEAFVKNFLDLDRYVAEPDPDNSDYVYLAEDLIHLPGRKYHRKKNHVNQFFKNVAFEYRPLDREMVECCLEMQEAWCQMKACVEKPDLLAEDRAVYEALTCFEDLEYEGGAIVINDKVEAFSMGEMLNQDTAVIHVEKANPDIPGLYAAINQRFCQSAWSDVTYINREQDKGIAGLRKAKESYHPHHMVNKYTLRPK
jgi:hypothetical protein